MCLFKSHNFCASFFLFLRLFYSKSFSLLRHIHNHQRSSNVFAHFLTFSNSPISFSVHLRTFFQVFSLFRYFLAAGFTIVILFYVMAFRIFTFPSLWLFNPFVLSFSYVCVTSKSFRPFLSSVLSSSFIPFFFPLLTPSFVFFFPSFLPSVTHFFIPFFTPSLSFSFLSLFHSPYFSSILPSLHRTHFSFILSSVCPILLPFLLFSVPPTSLSFRPSAPLSFLPVLCPRL